MGRLHGDGLFMPPYEDCVKRCERVVESSFPPGGVAVTVFVTAGRL